MCCRINRPVLDLATCRVLTKVVAAFPVPRRPDWSRNKSAAAVRAHVVQDVVNARGAERTFISADARFKRVRRQSFVAVFTGRAQFEHRVLSRRLTPCRSDHEEHGEEEERHTRHIRPQKRYQDIRPRAPFCFGVFAVAFGMGYRPRYQRLTALRRLPQIAPQLQLSMPLPRRPKRSRARQP